MEIWKCPFPSCLKKKKEVEFGNSSYRNQILSDPDFIHKLKHMKELENSTILNRKTQMFDIEENSTGIHCEIIPWNKSFY